MGKKTTLIALVEAKAHLNAELLRGQGRSWEPAGQSFLFLRENDKRGGAEVHERVQDVFVVLDGKPLFVVGGELIDPAKKEGGEFRAKEISGGERINLIPGDTLVIPAGTPHQRLANGQIFLQVFKIPAK